MILCTLAAGLVRRTVKAVGLGLVDRLLGAAFGFIRGGLLGVAILMAISAFLPNSPGSKIPSSHPISLPGRMRYPSLCPEVFKNSWRQGPRICYNRHLSK